MHIVDCHEYNGKLNKARGNIQTRKMFYWQEATWMILEIYP